MGSDRGVTFLLDANVLIDFQSAGVLAALVDASRLVSLAVAEKVLDEVTLLKPSDSSELRGKKRQAADTLLGAPIAVEEILPATPAAALMQALLAPLRTIKEKDHGEAASIAIAARDPTLVLVTGDNTAIAWALNELFHTGERVMRIPVFVRTLVERGALDSTAARGVADRAISHGAVPSWWATWIAGR